jgi:hypothetical protein
VVDREGEGEGEGEGERAGEGAGEGAGSGAAVRAGEILRLLNIINMARSRRFTINPVERPNCCVNNI